MVKKECKRGQFYIIASVIIILVLITLLTTSYIKINSSTPKIYDLSEELKIESGYVIDYGLFNDPTTLNTLVTEWTKTFYSYSQEYLTEEEDMVFVYGDENDIYLMYFKEIPTGSISINYGGGNVFINTQTKELFTEPAKSRIGNNQVIILLKDENQNEIEYELTLNPGQNFYFVIKTKTKLVQK